MKIKTFNRLTSSRYGRFSRIIYIQVTILENFVFKKLKTVFKKISIDNNATISRSLFVYS